MITGFNTNVRYSGRTFHVQTEDSGREHPHVISHLYFGGTILASERREYQELLGSGNLTLRVRKLMEQQHKSMLSHLKGGGFDALIAERLDGKRPVEAVEERSVEAVEERPVEVVEELPSESTAPETREARPTPEQSVEASAEAARPFGEGIVSEKPLDEVILEYLVKKARSRKAEGVTAGRGSRSSE